MNTIGRILAAIANAMKGFFKVVMKSGRATLEWVQERAPAVGQFVVDAADATGRTVSRAVHAIPNLLSRAPSGPSVAPAPTAAAAPLADQAQERQALLDAADANDRRRGLAIAVRAGARALLREQTPVGVPEAIRMWMQSLGEERLSVLCGMSPERIMAALDGCPTALGNGYQASEWERQAAPAMAVQGRSAEVVPIRSAIERRIAERLLQGRPDDLRAVSR